MVNSKQWCTAAAEAELQTAPDSLRKSGRGALSETFARTTMCGVPTEMAAAATDADGFVDISGDGGVLKKVATAAPAHSGE